jgi:hypothetical protein
MELKAGNKSANGHSRFQRTDCAVETGRSGIIGLPLVKTMDRTMLEDIKELFQAFIAPQLEGIKGDIRALDMKIDAKVGGLDTKLDTKIGALDTKIGALDTKIGALDTKIGAFDRTMESYRRELISEIHRVEKTLSTDFARLEQKVDLRLASMDEKLVLFRQEMLAEIKSSK